MIKLRVLSFTYSIRFPLHYSFPAHQTDTSREHTLIIEYNIRAKTNSISHSRFLVYPTGLSWCPNCYLHMPWLNNIYRRKIFSSPSRSPCSMCGEVKKWVNCRELSYCKFSVKKMEAAYYSLYIRCKL